MRLAAAVLFSALAARAATVSPLLARGYTAIPAPQVVTLSGSDLVFGPRWKIQRGSGVTESDAAVESLRDEVKQRLGIAETAGADGATVVELRVAAGSVTIGQALDPDKEKLGQQAYRLEMTAGRIGIAANAPQGLYYGVQTLVQILKRQDGDVLYPGGTITDWPDLGFRHMYWDDAHHLERLDDLKRALRQAAFFKINAFSIKLEGHFLFQSVPALVEPYALTPAEFQELTDYGLRHYVQVIPWLDAPAHIAFILKHPEYARLRAFPESNYELCVVNPDSHKLLEGMFQELIDANKGGKYFVLSTDEPYYIGMADNPQCREKAAAERLGDRSKLLVEFIAKTSRYLHDRGREVLFWGEYPIKLEDIALLPPYLINGEVYGAAYDAAYKARGIRQTIYTSIQGEESIFPDYFLLPDSRRLHPGRSGPGRVASSFEGVSSNPARKIADVRGMVVAGWADAGLHPETFWMGYAGATAAGWHPGAPAPEELISNFQPLFYGGGVVNMERVYQLLSTQAQFWDDSWEKQDSSARKPIWGNSERIFTPPQPATDDTLPLPPPPAADLRYSGDWRKQNERRLQLARESLMDNDEVLALLARNLQRAQLNRYNLEVLTSVARLCRQNLEMLLAIGDIEESLAAARPAGGTEEPRNAIAALDKAIDIAEWIRTRRNEVLRDTTATWQKSWYPRGGEANGRRFRHELDDVKDHRPDRTQDMSYLVYRELLLPFGEWVEQVRSARNGYAREHGLPLLERRFDWKNLKD